MRALQGTSSPGTANIIKPRERRLRMLLLLAVLSAAFFVVALKVVSPAKYANSDFFSFWLAGRMVITGEYAYSPVAWIGGHHLYGASWISDPTFLYPLPLSLLFAPLALLPPYLAFVLWTAVSQLMILASGALLLKQHPARVAGYFVLPLVASTAVFRPTILTLLNGQLTPLLLLILAGIVYLWERGKWWEGSLLLPLLALKPNLGIPTLGMLSFYLLLRRHFSALLSEGLAGLALLLIGFAQSPHWISDYMDIGSTKVGANIILSPTTWGLSAYLCGFDLACAVPPGALTSLIVLAVYVYFLVKARNSLAPAWAVSLSIAVMLLITPYTWQYDQLLLMIPIITITMTLAKSGIPFLTTALLFVGIDIFAFVLLWISARIGFGSWNVLIPLCVLALAAWAIHRESQIPHSHDSWLDAN